jgi:vitamin K-dependent gamma-carboxylase-like protein
MTRHWERWVRFAFEPVDTAPMAALRIAAGLLCLGWALSYLPDAGFFLGAHGAAPDRPTPTHPWEWNVDLGSPVLWLLVLAGAAVFMTVGLFSRLSSIAVLVLLIAIQRRDYATLNSGDLLLRALVFYIVLMPSGECWSVDAWFGRRIGREPQPRAPWGLRLLQIQVTLLYFFAAWDKLRGQTWSSGTAVGIVLQIGDLQRFAVPFSIATSPTVSAVLTYGTLATEIFLTFGLWRPRLRWWAIGAGLLLHLGIEATILVGWFSLAVIACYLAFVPAESLRSGVTWARARALRAGGQSAGASASSGAPATDAA